jgi:uncharacterized repeat protein (TIGR03847 family)
MLTLVPGIMADPRCEFTNVTSLKAEALGEPGQRTFRILVDSGSSSAVIWLEKEQLFQFAIAITQLTSTLPEKEASRRAELDSREAPPATILEFKLGKLALGHDGASGMFIIDAHDAEAGEDEPPAVRVWGSGPHVAAFAEEALHVCAAGRPLCPLCGGPIDPGGHPCPRTNGHALEDISEL